MRGEGGKETSKNEMDNRRIFMMLHMPLSAYPKTKPKIMPADF